MNVVLVDLERMYEAKLVRTLKKFTQKPITQVSTGHLNSCTMCTALFI